MPRARCKQRARAAALADDDLDGRLVQLVALLERRASVLARRAAADLELDQLAAELDGVLLEVLADPVDLGVGDVRPLGADDVRGAGDQEEHVAVAQQLVGAHLVEDDARVAPAGDLEGDPRGHVALDQAGDRRRPSASGSRGSGACPRPGPSAPGGRCAARPPWRRSSSGRPSRRR